MLKSWNQEIPVPGTRWELVGKRRGFEGNRIPEAMEDWEMFVFNRHLQVKGFERGFALVCMRN